MITKCIDMDMIEKYLQVFLILMELVRFRSIINMNQNSLSNLIQSHFDRNVLFTRLRVFGQTLHLCV